MTDAEIKEKAAVIDKRIGELKVEILKNDEAIQTAFDTRQSLKVEMSKLCQQRDELFTPSLF